MSFNPKAEAEKLARNAVKKILDPAIGRAKEAARYLEWKRDEIKNKIHEEGKEKSLYWINNTKHWAQKRADQVTAEAEEKFGDLAHDAEKKSAAIAREFGETMDRTLAESQEKFAATAQGFGDNMDKALAEELPAALHSVLLGLQELACGKVGDIIFSVGGAIAPGKEKIGLGFLEFEVEIKDKLPVIRKWIEHPPASGQDATRMIGELTDDDVIIFRPAKVPGLPYLGIDPRIPIRADQLPDLFDAVEQKVKEIFE